MADITFPEGISAFKPNERAPDFVKASISIDVKKFQEWLQTHPELRDEKGYIKLSIKESSKEGNKWYLAVNTYRPEAKTEDVPVIDESGIPF